MDQTVFSKLLNPYMQPGFLDSFSFSLRTFPQVQLLFSVLFAQNFLWAVSWFEAAGLTRLRRQSDETHSLTLCVLQPTPLQKADFTALQ